MPSEANIAPLISPGEVVDGKYRVGALLGQGGMGAVHQAEHITLGKRVALKLLLPELARSDTLVRRFDREARAVAKLESRNVARVIDVGTFASPSGDVPYIAMEHLEGEDLKEVLERLRRLQPPRAVDYIMEALVAIAEAHAKGIVHRDLKPSNLFIAKSDEDATLKVLDFGIAKALWGQGELGQSLTQTQDVLGSPRYMSPEQLRDSARVGVQSDMWSLGVVLYELLAGQAPFKGTLAELHVAILEREVTPLSKHCPDLERGLVDAVHRCLNKRPEKRFRNVIEMARALAPHGTSHARTSLESIEQWEADMPDHGHITAPMVADEELDDTHVDTSPAHSIDAVTEVPQDDSVAPRASRRVGALIVGAVVLLVAGGGLRLALVADDGAGQPVASKSPPQPSASASAPPSVATAATAATAASSAEPGPSASASAAPKPPPPRVAGPAVQPAPPPPVTPPPPPPPPPPAPRPSTYDTRE